MKNTSEKGSVVAYLLMTIFLIGLVAVALTQGAKKNATAQQIDEMTMFLDSDIQTFLTAIGDCALYYKEPADVDDNGTIDTTDNPNPPFPLYGDLSSGAAGDDLADIKCPGAPVARQPIFNHDAGRSFKLLSDTATYGVNYLSDATEGILIRITHSDGGAAWEESIARINDKYSDCEVATETAMGTCANGCLYFWIKRLPTSVTATEGATCP